MAFLLPALCAFVSDVLILYLIHNHDSYPEGSHAYLYSIRYAAPLAILRLILLIIPLPYHSYTGTAVKCPRFYQSLYGGTLILVLLQMLGLMIIDPQSLNSLLPTPPVLRRRLEDELLNYDMVTSDNSTTIIWWVLTLTLLSDLLHMMLLWHVRSTAPTDQKHVLYFYTGGRTTNGNGSYHYDPLRTQEEEPRRLARTLSDDFMSDLNHRFQRTKQLWNQRLEDFSRRMQVPQITAFRVLLQLFAYDDSVVPHQLDLVFEKDSGVALTFYVPQLLSFLLHGAYHNAQDLEDWVLSKCRINVYFAHKCYWFLKAWCLEGSHTSQNMSRNSSFSSLLGMDQPPPAESTKYPPEERSAMQGLLTRVVDCGELAAQDLHDAASAAFMTSGLFVKEDEHGFVSMDASPYKVSKAVETGILPIHPTTGSISERHLDSVTAMDKMGLLPRHVPAPTVIFMETPNFLDALLQLADSLFTVPREDRTRELRQELRRLEVELLPANAIYMPLTDFHHWVWRIVADESIAISTKERVPCIIAMEVVDYVPQNTSSQHMKSRGFSAEGLFQLMREGSNNPTPPASPGGSNHQNGNSLSVSHAADERQVVTLWRKSSRNPRRFETLLDKVTSFTRDTARTAQETLHKFQRLQQHSLQQSDEEAQNFPAPLSPRKVIDPDAAMGQWSTPISHTTPSKSGTRGSFSNIRKERIVSNEIPDEKKEDYAIEALLDIRLNMEGHQEPLATQAADSLAYGSTQRPKSRPPPVVFKESWAAKEDRIRFKSAYGPHPSWRLLPILVKSNDDLRQEQLASQLIYRMASILAQEKVPVWLCPYEIVALSDRGGIIEAIPDTISIDSLKRNDPNFESLAQFFTNHFEEGDDIADAKANFVESLAAYSVVCYLLQIKDRHNGNILLDNRGHLIHIDFGFFFLSSPGKNSGFESAPFKLTADFVNLMDGPHSNTFRMFRELCCRTFLTLRKHCFEITLLVEMLMVGNEDLNCFRGRPEDAVRGLRERFRLDLNDRACVDYVNGLVDESLENWRTRWYDRYQRFCVGVL